MGAALGARSATIRTALERYNSAARAIIPPRQTLEFAEVIEYAFLSDFDLLRDARQDVRNRPWATPTGRHAVDEYFKMLRAREEITRCNNEAQRIATHLRDEARFLHHHEELHRHTNPLLAHQIAKYRQIRGRFDMHHKHQLESIVKLDGFSGSIKPSQSMDTARGGAASLAPDTIILTLERYESEPVHTSEDNELNVEQEDDEAATQEAEDVLDILAVAMDRLRA